MVRPARRCLRTKTPPIAQQRVPSMGIVRMRMRSKGPPPKAVPPQPVLPRAPGGGGPPARGGKNGAGDYKNLFPPDLPQGFGGPPVGGGDEGDSDGNDGEAPLGTDEDLPLPQRNRHHGGPGSSGDDDEYGFHGHKPASMSINKWAKPIPKLDLPPRVHLQKTSKIKQIWELWSMKVAKAMSTCNDVVVTFWHQVYHQSESSSQDWQRSSMTERFADKKRYLYGRKLLYRLMRLLRHELLSHLPEWLSRKVGVRVCITLHTILFTCWKEIFPNEDATRFNLVNELYTLPGKMSTTLHQLASWLEDWMTKLVATDNVSAHIEPGTSHGCPHECG